MAQPGRIVQTIFELANLASFHPEILQILVQTILSAPSEWNRTPNNAIFDIIHTATWPKHDKQTQELSYIW